MHKLMLNVFKFIKNFIQFLKILTIFLMLMFVLYWIQNLTGIFWNWTSFIAPVMDLYADIGNYIYPGSVSIFNTNFEYKYLIAILLLILTYGIMHVFYLGACFIEDLYNSSRKVFKNIEQNIMNKSFENRISSEENKIKNFMLYFETSLKERGVLNTDLEEQNQILMKYLVEKLGALPEKFEGGYIYKFLSFDQIDNFLDVFLRLPKSKAPLNYFTCLQVINTKNEEDIDNLKKLISLKMYNKVISMADTSYRYGYNNSKRYEVSPLGVYRKDGLTFEVFEFLDNN